MNPILNALIGAGLGYADPRLAQQYQNQQLMGQIQQAGGIASPEGFNIAQQNPQLAQQMQASQMNQMKIEQAQADIAQQEQSKQLRQEFAKPLSEEEEDQLIMEAFVLDPKLAIQMRESIGIRNAEKDIDAQRKLLKIQGEAFELLNTSEKSRPKAIASAMQEAKANGDEALFTQLSELNALPKQEQDDALKVMFLSTFGPSERIKHVRDGGKINKLRVSGVVEMEGPDGNMHKGTIVTDDVTGVSTFKPAELPEGFKQAGETPSQKGERQTAEKLKREQQSQAISLSKDAFNQLSPIRSSIVNIDDAIQALNEGAKTGPIMSMLPNIREASVKLENLKNQMGLDKVASVTFGALSESELKFALDTALPTKLEGEALKDWLVKKREAQQKLYDNLSEAAIALGRGMPLSDFLEQKKDNSIEGDLRIGTVVDGYEYIGGDPSQESSWRKK